MTADEKRLLVESANGCKLNGYCCSLAGWANEMATLTPCTGGMYNVSWEAVARVVTSEDKDFRRENIWIVSQWWLGFGCNNVRRVCQKDDPASITDFFAAPDESAGLDPYTAFGDWAEEHGYDLDNDESRRLAIEAYGKD